jgi:multimeric flavodoxin WrbA
MKILAFNGSPRLKGNSATMLENAIEGAREKGAEVELFNLYKMRFSGCISCFSCKRLDRKRPIVCVVKDELRPVLEKVREIDGILIATPVYYGSESAATRALIERLCFPYLNYADYTKSHFPRRIPVGLIYTMNIPSELFQTMGYDVNLGRTRATLGREFGSCKMVLANNTTQYNDYSLYEANATGEAKKAYREAHFNDDCQNARQLGEELASGKFSIPDCSIQNRVS